MRLRKQISLFLSFAISITSMNVTALSNSISGMTKKAKATIEEMLKCYSDLNL